MRRKLSGLSAAVWTLCEERDAGNEKTTDLEPVNRPAQLALRQQQAGRLKWQARRLLSSRQDNACLSRRSSTVDVLSDEASIVACPPLLSPPASRSNDG